MEGLRQYAVSVVAAAIICSILTRLASQDTAKGLIRLLCGLVLTIVVIRPIVRMEFPAVKEITLPPLPDAENAVEEGTELAKESMDGIIKSTCEAYILNKANELGANIQVSVSVNAQHIPFAVKITGEVTSDVRKQLERTLEEDLGITKEHQSWTG